MSINCAYRVKANVSGARCKALWLCNTATSLNRNSPHLEHIQPDRRSGSQKNTKPALLTASVCETHTVRTVCTEKLVVIGTKSGNFPPAQAVHLPKHTHTRAACEPLYPNITPIHISAQAMRNGAAHAATHPWLRHRLPAVSTPPALSCGSVKPSQQH